MKNQNHLEINEKYANKRVEFLNKFRNSPMDEILVAPFSKWLDGRIIHASRGKVIYEFIPRIEMANPTFILHGGMQTAMLDEVIGISCFTLNHTGFHISINMNVNYIGRVKIGEKVYVHAKVIREGKKIVIVHGDKSNSKGDCIATAQSNLLVTNHKFNLKDVFTENAINSMDH